MNVKDLRIKYPKDLEVKLIKMNGEPQMQSGLTGIIDHVDDWGQVHVNWKNGSSLALNLEEDQFEIINEPRKIKVLIVEPGKYPKETEIYDDLNCMQNIVGGLIQAYYPFKDDVAIICNEEGKYEGLERNRTVYSEPIVNEMSYLKLVQTLRENEENLNPPMQGYIVFTRDSFDKDYTEVERTYVIDSKNKAFLSNQIGYSIYGTSLDGSDRNVRLDEVMTVEKGGKDGWKIEKCYTKDESNKEILDIMVGTFFMCRAPYDSENFESLDKETMKKYENLFKYPEKFFRDYDGEVKGVSYIPKNKDLER